MRVFASLLVVLAVLTEVEQAPRRRRARWQSLAEGLGTKIGRVQQVVKQTRIRIFAGDTKAQETIVSVFEPYTEIIRKGKANKPPEFGKVVQIQEAEHQVITHFGVFAERPSDQALLLPSVQKRNSGREQSGVFPMRSRPHSKSWIPFHSSRLRPSWANSWKTGSHNRSSRWGGLGRRLFPKK